MRRQVELCGLLGRERFSTPWLFVLLLSGGVITAEGCQRDESLAPAPSSPPFSMEMNTGGGGTGNSLNKEDDVSCDAIAPGRATARLLTRLQYENTLRDLLGNSLTADSWTEAAQAFPDEATFLGFGNNADVHRASLVLVEQHTLAAQLLASQAIADLPQLMPCNEPTAACVSQFIDDFGFRAFRRPVLDEEKTPLLELFDEADAQWGFDKGLELVLQSILQAPQVLYRTESLAAESLAAESLAAGSLEGDREGAIVALDSYQIASRLSYFLWISLPVADLFALARQGNLVDRAAVEEQARRMLLDDRARSTVSDFYRQWLGVYRFSGLARQVEEEGPFVSVHNDAWQQSLENYAQYAFWQKGGTLEALLGSQAVFLQDPETAALYGLEPSDGLTPVADPNRRGLLTQPALLALLSHPDQSAPIQRGKFVREQLLCQPLLPPPPTVDASPPAPDPNATTRERFALHTGQASCAGCHRLIDGIGFGLEEFDHLGRYRSEENGLPIDTSGDIQASTDPSLNGTFDGAEQLSELLGQSPQVQDCVATQWFRYAMGRAEQQEDTCNLEAVQLAFQRSNGDFRELFVALTTTDAFRYRPAGSQDL